jgi:hypothetical protein
MYNTLQNYPILSDQPLRIYLQKSIITFVYVTPKKVSILLSHKKTVYLLCNKVIMNVYLKKCKLLHKVFLL